MKKDLSDFIKELTKNDKKNLVEKTLKTTEEVGELAKAVLPYESAAGTLHRFVTKNQILENAMDVALCVYSIAYDLGYSDEEIESMLLHKAKKWSGIQAKEGKVQFPLPYEVHITVDLSKSTHDLDQFKGMCKIFEVKPIVIELEKNDEKVMDDVMTSSVHFGDNTSAIKYAESLAKRMGSYGYFVVRTKIETVPWHPATPEDYTEMPDNCYFESHLRIVTTPKNKVFLKYIGEEFDAHLSRNFFKKINDDEYIIMMTLRDNKTTYEYFKEDVEALKERLKDEGYVVDKTEIEFAVYDTNVNHDKEWIGNEERRH